ncbi:hypothetical protein KIF53_13365 [Chromobacterium subtsugae]|uniref:Uncharacterized protein n=2 Tax=Chromobacterium subtsugae TaxID=251747 RepID=A0ABS7FEW0_9NEIS|nr:hypothetical protein [Chromobacterium sp. F49]MBW8288618.1 hypothetical protein [Chromobacterium subtsugae]
MMKKITFALSLSVPFFANAASPQDASRYIQELDSNMKVAQKTLASGELKSISNQSQRFNQLRARGESFGKSVLDEPFGRCFAAGVHAQAWWQAQLDAAQRGGREANPGWIGRELKNYQENKRECLQAGKGGNKRATEQIASTSEIPPRNGCLKVLGVRADGSVGTVSYTCPSK